MLQPSNNEPCVARDSLSLTERLSLGAPSTCLVGTASGRDMLTTISHAIVRLLNSPKGSSQSNPDFGFDTGVDCLSSDAELATAMSVEIRRAVAKFEPRVGVRHVSVAQKTSREPDRMVDLRLSAVEGEVNFAVTLRFVERGTFELADYRLDE